jgi:predicted kinase
MHNEPFDAKYWRGRAEEALAAARQLDDRDARLVLLNMAGTYEQLAKRVEERRPDSEKS